MTNFEPGTTFTHHPVMAYQEPDKQAERRALSYLDKWAPDLVPMVLGGVL